MAEIMFVKQWVHGSYRERFVTFFVRTEERFGSRDSMIDEELVSTDPMKFLRNFAEKCPQAATQLLTAEDVDYFLYLCRER